MAQSLGNSGEEVIYMDARAIAERLGVSLATVYSYRKRGFLPEPDLMVGRSPAWRSETVEQWIATRPGRGVGGGRPRKECDE